MGAGGLDYTKYIISTIYFFLTIHLWMYSINRIYVTDDTLMPIPDNR